MKKTSKILLIVFLGTFFCSCCSTTFYVREGIHFKGKRVGIYKLNLMKSVSLEKLPEISRMETEAFYPYLIGAGFDVFKLQLEESISINDAIHKTDSLQLDYLIVGSGIVSFTGSSTFVHNLTINFVNTQSLKTDLSGTFEGPTVRISGVARRLGKKMIAKTK